MPADEGGGCIETGRNRALRALLDHRAGLGGRVPADEGGGCIETGRNRALRALLDHRAGLGGRVPADEGGGCIETPVATYSRGRSGPRTISVNFRWNDRACHDEAVSSSLWPWSVRKIPSMVSARPLSMTSTLIS